MESGANRRRTRGDYIARTQNRVLGGDISIDEAVRDMEVGRARAVAREEREILENPDR